MTPYRGERESARGFRGRKFGRKREREKERESLTRKRGAIDGGEIEPLAGGVGGQKWRIRGMGWPYMKKLRDFSF